VKRKFLPICFLAAFACGPLHADTSGSAPELYTVEDRFRSGGNTALSLHKLNYAIHGKDGLKLQYSFKYRVVDRARFYLSYTNYMLWLTSQDSIPVKDNVFNPEAFYRFKEESAWAVVDAGYHHFSNGRVAEDSRSVDRLFVRLHKAGAWGPMPWYVTSQVFVATLATGEFTDDYGHYVGWWDVTFWLRNVLRQRRSGLDLQLQRTAGRHGDPFSRGNTVLGAQYRLVKWDRINPILYVQWFSGYGEMLIDYRRKADRLRGGISWFY
jgi:phospholipase A1/A2